MRGDPLTIVTRTHGNNAALKDGTVVAEGVALQFVEVPVLIQAFRRMVRGLEFDVSEMAITTYLCAREHGVPFTALPVFLARGFHHGAVQRAATAGVMDPKDLEGRLVGVNRGYTVTTGVWARAVLAQEYGVDLDRVTWMLSGDEHVASYRPPANTVPLPTDDDLTELLLTGELAATIGVDADHPEVLPLVPDAEEVGLEALRSRGHYPINHLIVVRDDVLARRPEVAESLFAAFATAKSRYLEALRAGTCNAPTDRTYRRVLDATGADPLPYGIEPNRGVLEELIAAAVGQHILSHAPDIDALFAAPTRDLVG